MISVLLFKIKKWYANALKEYQDSKVSKMQDGIYNGCPYSDMHKMSNNETEMLAALKMFVKENKTKKAKHKKIKGGT